MIRLVLMVNSIRIPKPAYLLSQLFPRQQLDAAVVQLLQQLADLYQLGEIQRCYRAPQSKSLNYFVTTPQGKFVFRQQQLSEDDLVYERQILDHLQLQNFPAPRMLMDQQERGWVKVDEAFYSVYNFMSGYRTTDFLWLPSGKREVITQSGGTLARYHQVVADLIPSAYKWNGYRPSGEQRWREGGWFWQALKDIAALVQKSAAHSPLDNFVRYRLELLEQMLRLEPLVEEQNELSKVVIHGDYAPWNVFFRLQQPPFVLDFNESRLDLKIYDIVLATFWFAWRNGRLDQNRVMAFQQGYGAHGRLTQADIKLAGTVFRWIMVRSLIERLHKHYLLGRHPLSKSVNGLEKQCQICLFAEQQPQQLVAGLNGDR